MLPAKVLIIDDSAVIRHFVRMILDGEPGVGTVLEAASADDAWRVLDRETVDVITLDLNLPDGDGLQFIAPLRDKSGSDVIVLSGDSETHAAAMNLGAAACFNKETLLPQRAEFIASIRKAGAANDRAH